MKSICAFDIGIKNLSFCILTMDEDETYNIINWDLIDLRTNVHTCIGKLRNGNVCGKPAKLCHKTDLIYYCKKHASQYSIPEIKVSSIKDKRPCCYIDKNIECSKLGTNNINKKCYCNAHLKKMLHQNEMDNKLYNIRNVGCMKEPLVDLGEQMYLVLDKHPEILKVDKIVIENQPSKMNMTMKSISVILLAYYIMKKHKDIAFIAPSGKLKINEELTKIILSKCTKKNKYKITKELGIKYCSKLLDKIDDNEKWIKMFDNSKKRDDLGDSFLHAWVHMIGRHGLKNKEFIKDTIEYFDKKLEETNKRNNKKNKITLEI